MSKTEGGRFVMICRRDGRTIIRVEAEKQWTSKLKLFGAQSYGTEPLTSGI